MKFSDFKNNVEGWAEKRGIYEYSTAGAQILKGISENGELADAVIKGDKEALKDAIGDAVVCLVNFAKLQGHDLYLAVVDKPTVTDSQLIVGQITQDLGKLVFNPDDRGLLDSAIDHLQVIADQQGLDFLECCKFAWDEIKDRTGRMVAGGAFVKD